VKLSEMEADLDGIDHSEIIFQEEIHACRYSSIFVATIRGKQYAMKVVSLSEHLSRDLVHMIDDMSNSII